MSVPLLISAKTAPGPAGVVWAVGGAGAGGGGGGGGGAAEGPPEGPSSLKSATDPPCVEGMRFVIFFRGITDLGVPCESRLVKLGYIFCELINQTEEGPDPFDVFRSPRLLVSFEVLR
jgi:hypothetical protein